MPYTSYHRDLYPCFQMITLQLSRPSQEQSFLTDQTRLQETRQLAQSWSWQVPQGMDLRITSHSAYLTDSRRQIAFLLPLLLYRSLQTLLRITKLTTSYFGVFPNSTVSTDMPFIVTLSLALSNTNGPSLRIIIGAPDFIPAMTSPCSLIDMI